MSVVFISSKEHQNKIARIVTDEDLISKCLSVVVPLASIQPLSSHVYAEDSKKRELLIRAWRGGARGRETLKRRPEKEGDWPVLSVFLCLKYLMSAPALLKY